MESIIKKYQNKILEDWGSEMSEDAKQFAKDFKRRLTHNAKIRKIEVVKVSTGHYDISGFLKKDNKYVYFSYNIPRYETPIDLYSKNCRSGFLVRKAEHDKDYTGGYNNFCNLSQLFDSVEYLLEH